MDMFENEHPSRAPLTNVLTDGRLSDRLPPQRFHGGSGLERKTAPAGAVTYPAVFRREPVRGAHESAAPTVSRPAPRLNPLNIFSIAACYPSKSVSGFILPFLSRKNISVLV